MKEQQPITVIVQNRGCCAGCGSAILLTLGAIFLLVDVRRFYASNELLVLLAMAALIFALAVGAVLRRRQQKR